MQSFVHSLRRSAKARLTSEGVKKLELAPHDHAPSRLLGLLYGEGAPVETEVRAEAVVHHGEDLLSVAALLDHRHHRVIVIIAAVHEEVLLARMAVEVAVQVNFATLERLSDHLFDGVALREELGTRVDVLAVQIVAGETAAVVANNNSVRVEHWHYFEDVAVTEDNGSCIVADKVLNEALHDERAVALARMHSPSQYYAFSLSNMIL